MSGVKEALSLLSLNAKLIIAGAILLIIVAVGFSVATWRDDVAQARLEEREREARDERDRLQSMIDQKEGRAQAAEKKEEDARAGELIARAAVEAAGGRAEAALRIAEEEDAKYQQEMAAIGANVDVCTRLRRICSRLKIADKDCHCN